MAVKFLYGNHCKKIMSKWDKKANMGTLFGYINVGYIILINNKIIFASNVEFVEENVKCINLDDFESESRTVEESNYKNDIDDNCWDLSVSPCVGV